MPPRALWRGFERARLAMAEMVPVEAGRVPLDLFALGFAGESDFPSFLTDRSGKFVRNNEGQYLAPRHQQAEPLHGWIFILALGGQFDPYPSRIIGIEHCREQDMTLVNPTNLRLRFLFRAKEHLHTMQVDPRPVDDNRYAGVLVDLHSIDLGTWLSVDDDLERAWGS